jgi:cbb3-type cytochrome oxidase subunit 1
VIRAIGGLLFVIGSLIMVYNLIMTVQGSVAQTEEDALPKLGTPQTVAAE